MRTNFSWIRAWAQTEIKMYLLESQKTTNLLAVRKYYSFLVRAWSVQI